MKKVFTTGTFDLLHIGHINLLKKAKEENNFVIVGLNSDELISYKNPIYNYEQRKIMLEAMRYVDIVVPIIEQDDKFEYIINLGIDEFVIGSDYEKHPDIEKIRRLCNVRILDRTPDVSTTETKNSINIPEVLVIDIDDTILTVINRDFVNAIPKENIINKINMLHKLGTRIILFTARGMKSQDNNVVKAELKYRVITEDWLKRNGVKYDELLFGKPNADYYVDDKAMSLELFLKL